MDGPSTLQTRDAIVDVEAEPADLINEKTSHSARSLIESPSWPKIKPDGTPAAPSQEFQRRYYTSRYWTESKDDIVNITALSRLANLSVAYYQQDLVEMEEVLKQNGGTAAQNAREIERMIDEKRERNWFWPDQNLDRVVKFTTIAVTAITFPVVLLISPASIMFARDSSGSRITDPISAWSALISALKDHRPVAEFIARIIIGIVGAGTLLTPMIILSLVDPPMPYRVLTVCLCVVGFSTAAAVTFRPTTTELLGMVWAYTGILIVYVGTS
ncbi:hypothetical protein PCH_Pc12g07120 [Penicillium rubens Wisconsin 54-1255]|uniref:Uncharacterized protein n=1 Tax=Penicillium rubens (strain ATCC 28089 / DSM 1075 / NRRL 1951 / Wisconsin 54-1255) TaxID=500485 RepID=B6H0Y9_PENRW|nr:hypothetical protein PCH_Pc12g07120 [Penicillium rubens Wisconsin 54-1255]